MTKYEYNSYPDMDLIHKTCKNNFTILWFQVNSIWSVTELDSTIIYHGGRKTFSMV